MIRSEELETAWPGLIEAWKGTGSKSATRVSPPELSDGETLVFASEPSQLEVALSKKAGLIVASAKIPVPAVIPAGTRLFKSTNVGLAMASILPRFDRKAERFQQKTLIHEKSAVDSSAKLGKNVTVGPFAVIGAGTIIGDDVVVGANTVIEFGAKIGARTILHPQVFVGARCELGVDCEIHPHVTIGADGYGFARDKAGKYHKLPQLGRVVIGNRVEIGGNCVIDRAAFTETRIHSGVKMDNLVHIAHNCEIGEDSAITAGFFAAGSTKIGKRFMTGGNTVVADHLKITDDVMMSGRSTLTYDLDKPGAYGGYPVVPMKDHLRILAVISQLPQLKKHISKMMKHLGLEEEEK